MDLANENEAGINININVKVKVNSKGVFQEVIKDNKVISLKEWNKGSLD